MADDPTPAQAAAALQAGGGGKKAQAAQAAKKKKGQKVDLAEFLAATPGGTGSWADDVDDLPTGPSARRDDDGQSGQLGGGFARMGYGGGDRQMVTRDEIPIPDNPPFTAFVGNLSFEAGEGQLEELFGGPESVVSVRIVVDRMDNKPKGYAYVEFIKREGLESALGLSGTQLAGRPVRVSVAAAPKEREGRGGFDRGGDRDGGRGRMFDDDGRDEGRSMGDWTRSGPLPPLERERERSSFRPAPERQGSGFGTPREPERDVDWGAARGGKFTPSESQQRSSSGGFSGGDRGDRGGFGSGFQRRPSEMGEERRPAPMLEPSKADEASQWRRPGVPSGPSSPRRTPSSSTPGSPSLGGGRRKLELAPRGSTTSPSNDSTPPTPSSKPSPFGAAAPVNTIERERAIEEKMAAQRAAVPSRSASSSSVRDPPSRNVSQSGRPREPLSRTTSSSGVKVDPFGGSKPVDTSAREKEVDAKHSAAPRQRQVSSSSATVTSPTTTDAPSSPRTSNKPSPAQSLRKEGFSFASAAGAPKGAPANGEAAKAEEEAASVEEATTEVEKVSLEETATA